MLNRDSMVISARSSRRGSRRNSCRASKPGSSVPVFALGRIAMVPPQNKIRILAMGAELNGAPAKLKTCRQVPLEIEVGVVQGRRQAGDMVGQERPERGPRFHAPIPV